MRALFLGGDIRQKYASDYLSKRRIESEAVCDVVLDEEMRQRIETTDALVLPLPVVKIGKYLNTHNNIKIEINEIIPYISNNQIVFGGMVGSELRNCLEQNGITVFDYYEEETFKIYNAFLSAEGAIFYAKGRMNRSIHGSHIAIMGYGRIGKILSHLLHAQGAKISVITRKELDRVWSDLSGFSSENINCGVNIKKYDLIFNTIPANIFTEEILQSITDKTLIIDISSYPYGISDKLLEKHDLNYYREPSIPGRYAPQSAGEALGKTIINLLERRKLT